jgi:hypothetical protein
MDANERLMNAIFPNQSIKTCANCLSCMNKDNQFAYCIEKNQSIDDLNKSCSDFELERI